MDDFFEKFLAMAVMIVVTVGIFMLLLLCVVAIKAVV